MSVPIRQHSVPRMLLKRFVNKDGKLYYYDKRLPNKEILCAKPSNLFTTRHLYTQIGPDGEIDVSVEKDFSVLESNADAVIEKIVSAARAGVVPGLTTEEKEIWNHFLYYQFKRTPDFHTANNTLANFDAHLDRSIIEFERTRRPLTNTERANFQEPDFRERMKKNSWVLAVAKPGPEVLTVLRGKGLRVTLLEKLNKSFIISSFPIVRFAEFKNTHLSDPGVEMWFPIASDVAVSVAPWPGGVERLSIMSDDRHIRIINEALYKQSTIIASRSEELIGSLVGIR